MKLGVFSLSFLLTTVFAVPSALALQGVDELLQKLYQKNQELSALQQVVESKKALSGLSSASFYPTLNAVGGWGQNKTDEFATIEKGSVGYLEGKLNLFRGFKDQSLAGQRDIDYQISKIDFESKKKQLRLELTEVVSSIVALHKLQKIIDEEYKVTLDQKQMAAKKVAAGLTSAVDNLEFELRENEIQIEQKQAYQQHHEAHQKLIKLFGDNLSDETLEEIDFSNSDQLTKTSDQTNIQRTLEYRKTELALARANFEKSEARSEFLPSVDFTYGFGRLTPSEEVPTKFNESKYSLLLTIPLFSGFETYYRNKSALSSAFAFEKAQLQKKSDIGSDLEILKERKSELSALFQINEKKLVSLKKYFDLTLSEYKRGVKNSPDLVNATERLFSSKKKKYEILKELEVSKVRLQNYE